MNSQRKPIDIAEIRARMPDDDELAQRVAWVEKPLRDRILFLPGDVIDLCDEVERLRGKLRALGIDPDAP